jgi:hypothetical protein
VFVLLDTLSRWVSGMAAMKRDSKASAAKNRYTGDFEDKRKVLPR